MIFDYGFSLTGKSHITKGTCCQDSHKIKKLDNGWFIAAIADGVGSAKNSQIGSQIATETVVTMCEEYMPWDYNVISIKSMMRTAYNYAYKQILREAQKTGEPVESYDTTLSVVIYDGHRIIYGHSGDGAIIGLNTFGDYVEITSPQKGVDGVTVLPLRAGYTQWKIDNYDEELAAVLLMTDGMLEIFCPYLLKDLSNNAGHVYVPLASFFADPLGFRENEEGLQIKRKIEQFLAAHEDYNVADFYEQLLGIYKKRVPQGGGDIVKLLKKNNYPVLLMQNVQDDKTVVGLVNTEIKVDNKTPAFYEEPDWQKLQELWNRKAYPHLYAEKVEPTESELNKTTEKKQIFVDKAEERLPEGKKEQFVHLSVTESGRAKQVIEAYGRTAVVETKKVNPVFSPQVKIETGVKTDSTMERHDKPRKKGFIGIIGDVFD